MWGVGWGNATATTLQARQKEYYTKPLQTKQKPTATHCVFCVSRGKISRFLQRITRPSDRDCYAYGSISMRACVGTRLATVGSKAARSGTTKDLNPYISGTYKIRTHIHRRVDTPSSRWVFLVSNSPQDVVAAPNPGSFVSMLRFALPHDDEKPTFASASSGRKRTRNVAMAASPHRHRA